MKINHIFLMFFLCLLLLISTRAIQTSKDGNQFGVTKESKTKIGIDGWRDWGGTFWKDEQENNGGSDKEGGQGKGAKEKVGVTKESKTKIVRDDWRDWGGSFWEDGQENNGGSDKEGGQGKGAKEKGEVHESVTEGWRDWGGSFWDDEKEKVDGIHKEGGHGKVAKGKGEDNGSGRDNINGYNDGSLD